MLTSNIVTIADAVNLFLFSTAGALVVITIKGYPFQFNPLTHTLLIAPQPLPIAF